MGQWRGMYIWAIVALSFALSGCGGQLILDGGGSFSRDTAVTNSLGEAYLVPEYRSETVSVRNSSTDDPISGIQVLGLADDNRRLYVVADPNHRYHPAITSGESAAYYDAALYLTPVDQRLGTNATSYTDVDGDLLDAAIRQYGTREQTTTISNLRDRLSSLAYGKSAGLVVCLDQPLSAYADTLAVTEVAQRSTNLATAFQSIGWQYIFTSRGYSTGQYVNIWTLDPDELEIASYGSGALDDTLITIVAPTSTSSGPVLPNALKVELTWDAPVDLDLHLVRNGAYLYDSANDCYWEYLEQNWGSLYRVTDNPRLLFDNRSGYGPETVVLDEMTSGERYIVAVDYWGDAYANPSHTPTSATVRVWTRGSESPRTYTVTGFTYGAPETGQYKTVCTISGTTGDVTMANPNLSRLVTRGVSAKKK